MDHTERVEEHEAGLLGSCSTLSLSPLLGNHKGKMTTVFIYIHHGQVLFFFLPGPECVLRKDLMDRFGRWEVGSFVRDDDQLVFHHFLSFS